MNYIDILSNAISAITGGLIVFLVQTYRLEWRESRRTLKRIQSALGNISAEERRLLRLLHENPAKISDWRVKDLGAIRALEKAGVIVCLTPELEGLDRIAVYAITKQADDEMNKEAYSCSDEREHYGNYHNMGGEQK